jgi:hypothetical protein
MLNGMSAPARSISLLAILASDKVVVGTLVVLVVECLHFDHIA